MHVSNAIPARLGLGVLLLLSVFAWAPATFPGYWQGSEGFIPIFNTGQPAPIAHVAVTPDLWRGAGGATFLPANAMVFAGATPAAAVRYSFILCFLLGGIGIYGWLQPRLGDRAAGLAGLIYLLLPIFLATVYLRGSLPDAFVLAWLPLALWGLAAYGRERNLAGAALAILAILWLWRTQAGLAAMATLLLILYALLVERSWVTALIAAVAGAAGLVTLVPLLGLVAAPIVVFGDHFAQLHMLLSPGWLAAQPGAGEELIRLGFAALIFGLLATWGWWMGGRRSLQPETSRLFGFAIVGSVLLVLASLAASAPLWQITRADLLLTWPWQVLLLAAPLLAAAAGALPRLVPDLSAPAYWTALVATTVLGSLPGLGVDFTTLEPPARPVAIVGNNQVAVLDARVTRGDDPQVAILDVTWQPLRPLDFDYNIFFQAITGEGNGERVVAQLDTQPLAAGPPATGWAAGKILQQRYELTLPGAEAQPLRYYFGYYDWRDGSRLPLDDGIDDKLVLYGE